MPGTTKASESCKSGSLCVPCYKLPGDKKPTARKPKTSAKAAGCSSGVAKKSPKRKSTAAAKKSSVANTKKKTSTAKTATKTKKIQSRRSPCEMGRCDFSDSSDYSSHSSDCSCSSCYSESESSEDDCCRCKYARCKR